MLSIWAKSGFPEDIQAAVDEVGQGTVLLPEGDFEFNIDSAKTYLGYPVGCIIPGGVSVIGNKTVLRQTVNPPKGSRMFCLNGINGLRSRVSLIGYAGCVASTGLQTDADILNTAIFVDRATDWRVDHCGFLDFAGSAVLASNLYHYPAGINRGLVDHCSIDNPYKDVYGGNWGYGVNVQGTGLWQDWNEDINAYLGKYDGLRDIAYIEDSTFSRCRHSTASNTGAFYVIRHSTFSELRLQAAPHIDVHGYAGAGFTGGRGVESYYNTIIGHPREGYSPEYAYVDVGHRIRGGGGVIHDNHIIDCWSGVRLAKEDPLQTKNWVKDLWIWNNVMAKSKAPTEGPLIVDEDNYVEGVDYFLNAKPYTPYPYPHPLTFEAPSTPISPLWLAAPLAAMWFLSRNKRKG